MPQTIMTRSAEHTESTHDPERKVVKLLTDSELRKLLVHQHTTEMTEKEHVG